MRNMTKLVVAIGPVLALVAALAAPAGASHPSRTSPSKAFGAATFSVSAGQDERASFFAVDKGTAAHDRGFINYRNVTAGFGYRARLVCVDVEGKTARFGYVIPDDPHVPAAIRGSGVVFQVVDNSKSGPGHDTVGYVSGPAAIATACDSTVVANARPITAGNVVVKHSRVHAKKEKKDKKKKQPAHDDDTTDDDTTDDTTDD